MAYSKGQPIVRQRVVVPGVTRSWAQRHPGAPAYRFDPQQATLRALARAADPRYDRHGQLRGV